VHKKKSSESTSTSGSAQAWATPYATAGANAVQSVFNQNQPGLQQLTDLTHNDLVNPLLGKFQSSLGGANQAQGYYQGVLSGQGGNPFLGQVLQPMNDRIANDVNSHFALSGRYGSDAHGAGLTRELANADGQLMYQDYNDTQARKGQAAAALAGGNLADTDALMAAITGNAQLPYVGSANLGNSLGALFNGGTQKSVSYSPNPIWGAVGAGISAAGAAFSDRRLKTKIKKVGEFEDGLGIYEFAYHWAPNQMLKGVMADEVKELRPHAYIPNYRGEYAGVNYAAL
jgi:hypothetical protein